MSDSLWPHSLPVPHHLMEFAQVHVHWISDATQPYNPLLPSSPFAASGGQCSQASSSASALLMSIQGWFPLELTGLISLQSKGLSRSLLQHHNLKAQILQGSAFFMVQLSRTGKTIALTLQTFVSKVMSLLFNFLSRFGIALLSKSKHLLIWQLQSPSAVILVTKKRKSVIASAFFSIYLPWSDGTRCHDLNVLNVEL